MRLLASVICFLIFSFMSVEASDSTTKNADAKAGAHGEAHWGYVGLEGPDHWGSFSKACESGHEQSPINLIYQAPKKSRSIDFHYNPTKSNIVNNGHTLQINFAEGNHATIDGQRFDLLQMHFHAHSEHSLSGRFYPMEAHLVHKSVDGKLAVVGLMFVEGKQNLWIQQAWSTIPTHKNEKVDIHVAINPLEVLPAIRTHYHYMGSLTTPPCSEGVNWNVMNTPVELSKAQIDSFRQLYSDNYRPIQAIHMRQPANFR